MYTYIHKYVTYFVYCDCPLLTYNLYPACKFHIQELMILNDEFSVYYNNLYSNLIYFIHDIVYLYYDIIFQ